MGGILSYNVETEDNNLTVETIEDDKVNKSTQTNDEECIEKCKELKSRVENLEEFCKYLEEKVLNLERGRRTMLL
tara:strand:- start:3312 stop:3536 length:225 start_codon:yes stop_codon:yes gene_type:complete